MRPLLVSHTHYNDNLCHCSWSFWLHAGWCVLIAIFCPGGLPYLWLALIEYSDRFILKSIEKRWKKESVFAGWVADPNIGASEKHAYKRFRGNCHVSIFSMLLGITAAQLVYLLARCYVFSLSSACLWTNHARGILGYSWRVKANAISCFWEWILKVQQFQTISTYFMIFGVSIVWSPWSTTTNSSLDWWSKPLDGIGVPVSMVLGPQACSSRPWSLPLCK